MLAGRAKGRIRPPRKPLTDREDSDFDSIWSTLASSFQEIHMKNSSQLSFEQLYRNAYKLVLKKEGERLYDSVIKFEENWLAQDVQPGIRATVSPILVRRDATAGAATNANESRIAGDKLMRALKSAFEDHYTCMSMTADVLMYLDRIYCASNRRPCIFIAALGQFRDHVLRAPFQLEDNVETSLSSILVSVILGQIRLEREGDLIDKTLIRSCVYLLESLYENDEEVESGKLYLTTFEPEFLSASREFYHAEGQNLLRNVDAGSYCRHVKKRISEESDRCQSTLSPLTLSKIKAVIDKELVKDYMREVIGLPGSGVKFMLDNDRLDELAMVYDLISRVDPSKADLKEAVQKRVMELGFDLNSAANLNVQGPQGVLSGGGRGDSDARTAPERAANHLTAAAIQWVDDVLRLKDKYDKVLKTSFQDDRVLHTAITKSFSDFINSFTRGSETLSLFFDENMKKGIKGKTENEVDALLDKGILLLRYIHDQDMFERYYKRHLSKRLLMKKSISMDAERQMISKLKAEVGNSFTQRIESMFKDMSLSEDLSGSYRKHVAGLGAADHKRPDLEVHILTTTMWPLDSMGSQQVLDSTEPCIYPPTLDHLRTGFENFYLGKHSGRRLTWQSNMGTVDMRAYFPKSKGTIKVREINVSTYAAIILLLFNDLPADRALSCDDIQGQTDIPMHDLTRNLQSLAVAPKTRVLIKEPMSKDIKPTDTFTFNDAFHSPFSKLKIGVVSGGNKVEDQEERRQTELRNNQARGGLIEAAVVRIMKQRKELSHQMLVTEVIQQLSSRFSPDITMLKQRIEGLIEKEYLERVEDADRPAYRYLA